MSGAGESRDLAAEIEAAVGDQNLKGALFHAVSSVNEKRRQAIARFPGYAEARDAARRIKEAAIADLPAVIERFTESVQRQGGHVYSAADGEEACRMITAIAKDSGARRITKAKSMTSEEIHLNGALEAAGIEVRETDLGEYIIQLAGDRPSHIIAPIIHMSVDDVRRVFRDKLGIEDVPEEPAELTQLARQKLRADFLSADLGITGANFLLADTGTVVIVENEGNIRMTTQVPPVHVVITGIEKLLPRAADLLPFLQLLPRSGTGQLLTSYLSFISGPGWGASPLTGGAARSFHVVLLDNGRMAMRDDELLREALYCIRCGACMTVCPPYQVVGGHVYGGPTYHSGIGAAWEAGVSGLDTAATFNDLCTTCSRCQDVCPVHIDIPWMNTVIRERIAQRSRRPRGPIERLVYDRVLPTAEEGSVGLAKRLFSDPARVYSLSRRFPWSSLMRLGPARAALSRFAGLAAARPLPSPSSETLSAWHRRRGGRLVTTPHEARRLSNDRRGSTVFLFSDCHTEYVDTDVGKATVSCLEKCGLGVVLVAGQCCGRAALSQGMLRTARGQAKGLQELLAPVVETGQAVVGIEPSCVAAVVDDHAKLLPGGGAAEVAAGTREILEFLHARLSGEGRVTEKRRSSEGVGAAGEGGAAGARGAAGERGATNGGTSLWTPAADGASTPVVLHGHCQQKTLGWLPAAVELLGSIPGVEVRVTSSECCGMAGSFGYKSDYYPISVELGRRLTVELEELAAAATRAGGAERTCEYLACGTSCRAQIADIGARGARHPVELIDERLAGR